MENFDVKVFESHMSNEALNRAKEELYKNPEFQINDDNITEFLDCKLVLDILKEHKIEYKIITNDRWKTIGKIPQYDLMFGIYISQEDYALIKYILEPESQMDYDDYDVENDKITKKINLTYNIVMSFMFLFIGIPFLILGIQFIDEDMTTAIIFLSVGGGCVLFVVSKIIKFINNKFIKRL